MFDPDPVETRGPEPADRSPEPADGREWTLDCENYVWHAKAYAGESYPKEAPPVAVVPKSRLESAMAAADEREADLARLHFEALEREKVLEARGAALTEALREKQAVIDFAAQALRSSQYVGGPSQREAWHLATVALFDAETEWKATNLAALPVEGEPEEGKR